MSLSPAWRALAVLTLARTSMGFQFQSIASVSPQLIAETGISYADLGTLIGLYNLPGIVMALPGAALGRRFGDTRIVAIGLGLMAAGGLGMALAGGFAGLALARLGAGVGGVLLSVVMTKMVADWFAGQRSIALAMAVFVNSFPMGVGAALALLGWLGPQLGWAMALGSTAVVALAALALLLLAYRRHPNDAGSVTRGGWVPRIPLAEAAVVSVAGAIWGCFNGAFAVMFGFAPTFLTASGLAPAAAGLVTGAATWLVVASGPVGGVLVQRGVAPGALLALGSLGWAACLAMLAGGIGPPAAALLLAGCLMGLPIGVIVALPALALQPENRALGMGLFYVWLYVGHASLPPLAGWVQDVTGSMAAALLCGLALVLVLLPLYAVFRAGLAALRRRRPLPA